MVVDIHGGKVAILPHLSMSLVAAWMAPVMCNGNLCFPVPRLIGVRFVLAIALQFHCTAGGGTRQHFDLHVLLNGNIYPAGVGGHMHLKKTSLTSISFANCNKNTSSHSDFHNWYKQMGKQQ